MILLSKQTDFKLIGVTGGSSLVELGSAHYVYEFFLFLDSEKNALIDSIGSNAILDRLFRRYIRREEINGMSALLKRANMLDLNRRFSKVFEGILYCIESAEVNFQGFKSCPGYLYEPVRLIIADQPWFLLEKKRPLIEYDELQGDPFWLR